ncbi:YqkE family protein [Metabacillus iocasae]|uniref:RNA-binding protein with RPS1 domain n=1 Tax=Priestia iocasae TaxID=2291674 RepID=A0ABS2QQB4_9BACI|nr:YqkE family protein [Metabacillus iocasae]MBM7701642.1 putative RNA-binding protein with RPS1 domain [Metabacillus iocasae]
MAKQKKTEDRLSLKDQLDTSLLEQLKQKKQALQAKEVKKQEEEQKKREEARKKAEKNKTFEQLLSESDLNWKQYK